MEKLEKFGGGGFVEADKEGNVSVDASNGEIIVEPEEEDFLELGAEKAVEAGSDGVAINLPGLGEQGEDGLEGGSPKVGVAKAADAKFALRGGDSEIFERPEKGGVEGVVERFGGKVFVEAVDEMFGRPVE